MNYGGVTICSALHLEDHIKVHLEVRFFPSLHLKDHIKVILAEKVEEFHLEDHIKVTSLLRSPNTFVVICMSQKIVPPRGSHQIDHVEILPPRGSHQIYHIETLQPTSRITSNST
ncbi:hypothetical protein AAC387_Pa01g4135 [Persea americana]